MNKKGLVREAFWIFSLIICMFFLLTMLAWIDSQVDEGGLLKHYLTRDISLTLETVQIGSGNVNVSYVTKIPILLEIKDGKVWVKDVERESFDEYYFTSGNVKINFPKQVVYELNIYKEGDKMSVEAKG